MAHLQNPKIHPSIRSEHITPALISLHWMRVPERISFKLAVLTYQSIHGTSPTAVFHPRRWRDINTTAAVFCLSSSRSTARSTLYSRQTGVPSCRRQHVERPSVPHHICTVTRGLQTASQDFPLLSFLPGHPDMTYLLLSLFFFVFFLAFSVDLAIIDII